MLDNTRRYHRTPIAGRREGLLTYDSPFGEGEDSLEREYSNRYRDNRLAPFLEYLYSNHGLAMTLNDCWKLGLFPLTLSGVLLGMQSRQTIGFSGPDPIVYRLVPASRFQVRTGKSGLFGFAGHSHEVRARAVNGWVVYNAEHPSASRLEVKVPAESLQVLTPSDTAEIRKVTERMRTDVLQVSRYPEIRFSATVAAPTAKGFRLNGELTMVGHTRPVPVDVTVRMAGDTLWADGKFSAKQTDFGIKPVTAGPGGAVKVADEVKFEFAAVAVRDPAARTDNAGVPIARAAQ